MEKLQLQFTNCGMKNITPPIRNDTNPLPFIHSKESTSQVSALSAAISFFLGRGKALLLAALLQSQEVVLVPQVAGLETVTHLARGWCFERPGPPGLEDASCA